MTDDHRHLGDRCGDDPIRRYPDLDEVDLAFEAASGALDDAGVEMADVDVLAAGAVLNPAGLGQQVQKQLGQHGIPVYNVTNVCATGATAIRTVYMALASGEAEIGLAVGVEQMGKAGLLGKRSAARVAAYEPTGRAGAILPSTEGVLGTDLMPALFSHAATDYMRRHPHTRNAFSRRSPRRTTPTPSTTRSRCTSGRSRSKTSSPHRW